MSRRRTVRRVMAVVLGVPLGAILLLAIGLAWVLATESGTQWAVEQAREHLPDNIRLGRVEGVLAGPLVVHGLGVDTPAARLDVRRVDLDWDPSALVWSEIRVTGLALEGVEAEIREVAEDDEESPAPALPGEFALPVRIVVEHLAVSDVAVRLPDDSVQRVDSIILNAAGGPEGIRIENLEVSAPLGDMQGAIRLESGTAFGLDGNIRWRVRPPEPRLSPLAGTLRLGGSLRRLQARLEVDQPANATLRLQAQPFADTPRWSGHLRLPATAMNDWWSEAPPLVAGADFDLRGTFAEAAVEGDVSLEGLATGPLAAQLEMRASPARIHFDRLHVEAEQRPGATLDGSGELDLEADRPRFRARLEWRDIAWPLDGGPLASSESGSARISGTPNDYTLSAEARLRTPQTGDEPVRVDLEADGSLESLTGITLSADWHETRLHAGGSVRWTPSGQARLDVDLAHFDPSHLVEGVSGQLSAKAELRAEWNDSVSASLDLQSAEGTLNGQPLNATARLRHEDGTTHVDRLRLVAGGGTLEASGRIDKRVSIDWRVDIPDLAGLVPDLGGSVQGEGNVRGPVARPEVTISLEAAKLVSSAVDIATLAVDGHVAPLGGARSALRAEATDVVTDAIALDSVRFGVEGTPEDHRLELDARGDRGSLELALTGGLSGFDWQGRLVTASLAPAGLPQWVLVESAGLAWRDRALDLDRTCWRSGDARLCASAAGNTDQWRASLEAAGIPLGLIASLARDDLGYSGTFGLEAELSAANGPVTGRAKLELNPGSITGVLDEQPETLLEFGSSTLQVELGRDAVDVDARLNLAGEDGIRVNGRVGRESPRALAGRVRARIGNLGLVSVLAPAVGRMEGTLMADLELDGRVEDPILAGTVTIDEGRLELVPLGIVLTDLEAELSTAERALDLEVRAASGEGRVAVQTRIEQGEGGWQGSGRITGADFEAVNLPEVTVAVTPDLDWRLEGREVTVDGTVRIPSARIEPRDLSNTVQSSADTMIVGAAAEQRPEPEKPFRVFADVQVELGSEVRIDAFGLKGRLEGGIRVREAPQKATEASGELRVAEGSYSIYAQRLAIERGRILFDGGPAANPGLDVRAVRRPGNVVVGVHVRGRLREPRVTLFSEPAMQESQQLSYLLFGVPIGQTSEGQQSNVAAAATMLARSEQGSNLVGRVGIQEVSVDNGAPGEGASLVLGRYLSPRLYVGYGIGLMEQANSVRVRYDLTRHWALEARSGATSSADLLYSIEVDTTADALPDLPQLPGADEESGDEDEPDPPAEPAR